MTQSVENKNQLPILTEDDLLELNSVNRTESPIKPGETEYWKELLGEEGTSNSKGKFTVKRYKKNKDEVRPKSKKKKHKKDKKQVEDRYPYEWIRIKKVTSSTTDHESAPVPTVSPVLCPPGDKVHDLTPTCPPTAPTASLALCSTGDRALDLSDAHQWPTPSEARKHQKPI